MPLLLDASIGAATRRPAPVRWLALPIPAWHGTLHAQTANQKHPPRRNHVRERTQEEGAAGPGRERRNDWTAVVEKKECARALSVTRALSIDTGGGPCRSTCRSTRWGRFLSIDTGSYPWMGQAARFIEQSINSQHRLSLLSENQQL